MTILKKLLQEKYVRLVFLISLIIKGAYSLLEVIGGLIVIVVSKDAVVKLITVITQDELAEDPRDYIATHLSQAAQHYSINAQHVVAFYLLSHGIIKCFLIAALLKKQLWAYPLTIAIFGAFIIYQSYQYAFSHSIILLAMTIMDIVLVALTIHEYHYIRKHGFYVAPRS